MFTRRILMLALIGHMVVGTAIGVAGPQNPPAGALAGKADDEADQPYSNYTIRVRTTDYNQTNLSQADFSTIADSATLDSKAQFSFPTLTVPGYYLIELYDEKNTRVVCQEGPFELTAANPSVVDVNVDCGRIPAFWWIAGTVAGVAITTAVVTNEASASE
jgi:hypothetical protein